MRETTESILIRTATMADVPDIHRLINYHAELNRMLFRSHTDIYEHLRDFIVCVEGAAAGETVVGCVAVELVWRDLAEVKSLAVDPERQGRGIGRQLVQASIEEARRLALARLFTLTREEQFFARLGFVVIAKDTLPHKVWTDCVRCALRDNCDEIAMVLELTS
jgi:amino-acid N-acetyltransferase